MKFTDGYWLMRKGLHAAYPTQAYDVTTTPDSMTVYAPTQRIQHRGDTLKGPLLTVQFSSPMADVIRVRLTHFAGQQPQSPQFELFADAAPDVRIAQDKAATTLTSGRLSARVAHSDTWRVEFLADERVVTASPGRGMGIIELDDGQHFMHEQLALGVGETVYGLGERFTAFVKNGQVVDIWNQDGGTGSEQAYKNVPFYLTNRGYGVFVNHPEQVSFEVASEKVSRVQFSVAGHALEYYVIYGPTPKEVLAKYTALTGKPALPPAWSFGLWLSTSFTTSYDEATVTSFIQGMADRDLPLHVFHFDCFWMREFNWCDFEWDPRTFPDPPAMLQRLKDRGLHICVWINPYIAQRSPLFAEGMQHGYLIKKPNGDVWQWDLWQPGMAIVDFTNPDARQWFGDKLRALLDMGVDCFKTDFGERISTDVVYFDGSDPAKMHNYYTHLYNKTVFDLLEERRGRGEVVLFARSATAGGQQFPVHWGGDCYSDFESMAESLRGGLSLGVSGFGFWSHDIGGFEGTPPTAVYKRWIAFGLLSSHSRLHGSHSYRVPWLFDEEAVDVLRLFTKLKCRLMPYLFGQAVTAHEHGTPMMRAMLLEFPEDRTCDFLDRQYMLGDNLLVAPVFALDGEVTYYLPAGRWTNFLSGAVVEGPGWQRETHAMLSLPLMVRPNTIIPVGSNDARPDYDYGDGVTLRVYELADRAQTTLQIPTLSGEVDLSFAVRREGQAINVERQGADKPWQILLVNVAEIAAVEGGDVERSPEGALVTAAQSVDRLSITLNDPA
ncbi:MAG: alpha-xylosidase [Chloroflexi bacterium]|nr:alpha-xylosidase [Chloroflexota bacterium]